MKKALEITGLSVSYGSFLALHNVNIDFRSGSLTGIIGPNGAGKSTLVRAVLGLLKPQQGRVTFEGRPLSESYSEIGYVPQHASVDWDFPATVRDVVAMGTVGSPELRHRAARHAAVDRALALVGAEPFAAQAIGRLSGGQKQRTFLARALVKQPRLLILDEPFAGVDAPSETAIITALKQLQQAGTTIIIVHHDLSTVTSYFTDVVLVNRSVIAQGATATTFTQDNLSRTYGIDLQGIR